HTFLPSAFCSPGVGPVGFVVERQVRLHYRIPISSKYRVPSSFMCAPVALVKVVLDDRGCLLDKLSDLDYDGVVIEGVGGGHVPAETVPTLENLARTKPVVLCSRANAGGALVGTYGYAGSE